MYINSDSDLQPVDGLPSPDDQPDDPDEAADDALGVISVHGGHALALAGKHVLSQRGSSRSKSFLRENLKKISLRSSDSPSNGLMFVIAAMRYN